MIADNSAIYLENFGYNDNDLSGVVEDEELIKAINILTDRQKEIRGDKGRGDKGTVLLSPNYLILTQALLSKLNGKPVVCMEDAAIEIKNLEKNFSGKLKYHSVTFAVESPTKRPIGRPKKTSDESKDQTIYIDYSLTPD